VQRNTSWQKSATWYNRLVGDKGHFYHQTVLLPGILRLLQIDSRSRLLDIGCGQGILAKQIPPEAFYTGIDLAASLVQFAKRQDRNQNHHFFLADATRLLPINEKNFTHATAILSLQNMEKPEMAIKNMSEYLIKGGKFVIVLNHPCFRIPRQSGWGMSENKIQYRYINMYMSPLKIPILMHPGENKSPVTWSFHHPLSFYTKTLCDRGFVITNIEEWTSSKESAGKMAKTENRARNEIPLFLTIAAMKQ